MTDTTRHTVIEDPEGMPFTHAEGPDMLYCMSGEYEHWLLKKRSDGRTYNPLRQATLKDCARLLKLARVRQQGWTGGGFTEVAGAMGSTIKHIRERRDSLKNHD